MEKIEVDAGALRALLVALTGPPHLIRELQATRDQLPTLTGNPIDALLGEFNAWAEAQQPTAA